MSTPFAIAQILHQAGRSEEALRYAEWRWR